MRGSCLCGTVEFEITGPVPRVYQCHCSLCRKQGGSVSNTATLVPRERFRWLGGEDHVKSWVRASGFRSDFCANCGSTVPNPLRDTPYVWVPTGMFDAAENLGEVAVHLYVGSRARWDTAPLAGKAYATMPPLEVLARELAAPDGPPAQAGR